MVEKMWLFRDFYQEVVVLSQWIAINERFLDISTRFIPAARVIHPLGSKGFPQIFPANDADACAYIAVS